MANILITEKMDDIAEKTLRDAGHNVILGWNLSADELNENLKTADAILVRIMNLHGDLIADNANLKIISKHGVGLDNIDLNFTKKKGIEVTVTPGANSQAVAEHTVTMMMALAKNLPLITGKYREMGFGAKNIKTAIELNGKTVGILGYGNIGKRVAKILKYGFDMRVLVYDPYIDSLPEGFELISSKEEVLRNSDFITIHLMLTEDTFHLIGEKEFDMMKDTAILINCARGPHIDEEALIRALQDKKIAGAGLDVTEAEPCSPENPLFHMENVILTPHYAPTTKEAAYNVAKMAADNLVNFFEKN